MLRLEQRRADSLRRRSFEPPIIGPDQLSQQRASQAVFCPSPGCADNQGLRLLRQVLDPAEGRVRGRHARLRLTSGAGGRDWETTLACLNRIGVGLKPSIAPGRIRANSPAGRPQHSQFPESIRCQDAGLPVPRFRSEGSAAAEYLASAGCDALQGTAPASQGHRSSQN